MVNGFEEDGRYSLLTDGSLIIDNVTIHNSGFYSCRVTEHGVLRILRLDVRGKYRSIIGSRALSFSGPLLSVSVDFYMCVRNFEVQYLENQRC